KVQRFIVGDQDIDGLAPSAVAHVGNFDLAVSKTASPATLTKADWFFVQVSTTENDGTPNGTFDADYPGNFGYNADAFVVTFNMFPVGAGSFHVQVNSVKISALINGTLTAFQNDIFNAGSL